jgi:formylglycine-generating enzyme required for sulfatase activity
MVTALPRLLLLFACVTPTLARGAEPDAKPWPLWDGQETIVQYAQHVNLPPTKTLDLGNGVKLELVLIPAGEFIMGTPEPEPVDEAEFCAQIALGQMFLVASVAILLVLVGVVVVQAIRRRRRPQYSLARLLAMVIVAGAGVFGGVHWWQSSRTLESAKAEYQSALVRYDQDASPAHKVVIAVPFCMGKFTVTQEQYQQVMGTNPSWCPGNKLPVQCASWDDAQEFCKKLWQATNQTVRLPTEAEWEYACRAGTSTNYYSGNTEEDLKRVAWYHANSGNTIHAVGQKESNRFGLYDMHGNVWEWCAGAWRDDYAGGAGRAGPGRALRGGCWHDPPGLCRSAARLRHVPHEGEDFFGFRVALASLEQNSAGALVSAS